MQENLNRILPSGLSAHIDLGKVRILPIFKTLKKFGGLQDADMLRTFNMGVGVTAVVRPEFAASAIEHLQKMGVDTYEIGVVEKGSKTVEFDGELAWD